jgi:hypothetical protein
VIGPVWFTLGPVGGPELCDKCECECRCECECECECGKCKFSCSGDSIAACPCECGCECECECGNLSRLERLEIVISDYIIFVGIIANKSKLSDKLMVRIAGHILFLLPLLGY